MVYSPRIGPDGAFVREIKDIKQRISSFETRPAGQIVIRETLTTEDPVTGVKTVVGQLPDGSYGVQPFIGDVTPPPVATTPIATAQPGIITVTWDGLFVNNEEKPRDFEHVNVIGHKLVNGSILSSVVVGVLRLPSDTVLVTQDIAAIGETWQFSLESEDYNGNKAALSSKTATITMLSAATDEGVNAALAAVNNQVISAQSAAASAQTAANNAQTSANNAAQAASDAAGIATSKSKVLIQSAAPATADQNSNVLWIDTTNGLNAPKRWNGSSWVTVTDKAATDAATAAANAQTKADQAFSNAATAATAAGNAQTTADGKNRAWYQTTAPAGTGNKTGDQWYDTSNGNKLYLWTGSAWTPFQDAAISTAQSTANSALTSANGKSTSYYQATQPTGGTYIKGDLWFDTANGYKMYTYSGSAWQVTQDSSTALTVANSKVKTYIQSTAPAASASTTGDLWIDTANGNQIKRWSGSAWVDARDTTIAAAQSTANTALTSANGKNRVYYQGTMPSGGTYIAGDTWFDTSNGNKIYVHNGTTFVSAQDTAITTAQNTANTAVTTANSKTKTYFQTTQPSNTGNTTGDIWFDTANGNKVYVWNGTAWTVAQDAAIAAAQTSANGKNTNYYQATQPSGGTYIKGDLWFDTANSYKMYTYTGSAWQVTQDSSTALTTANSKTKTFTQGTVPTATTVGDIWIDTSNGNVMKVWTGAAWTAYQDAAISSAQTTANNALTSANGKNKVYYQTAQPTGGTYITGDTWFDTDDGNKIYVYNGSAWIASQDASIATAQTAATNAQGTANSALTTANSKTKTYFQTAQPAVTGNTVGDTWFDTDDSNKVYVWNGSSWASARDAGITSAANAAATAQQAANDALTAAQAAQAVADGAIRTWYQSSAPTGLNSSSDVGDLWFDTDDGQAYRWNGATWIVIEDNSIAAALAAAQNAQTTADGKITSYYQPGQPATGSLGDLWFDTDDKNKPYYCSSTSPLTWTVVRDGAIADAQATANTALTSANGKNRVFYQTAMPTGSFITGDTWFDTDDGNKIYVYNGATFVNAQDASIAVAQSTANTKTKTYFQTTQPSLTGNTTGDIWFDTSNGNKPYVWNGSAWASAQDATIASAQNTANTALTSANGKNKTYYQTAQPTGGTYIIGDTWFDTDDGNKIYVYNGSAWIASQDATIAAAQSTANTANSTANSALTTANSKTKTYFQSTQPSTSGNTAGDIWFDTGNGNKVYVWNGSAWTNAQDAAITAAQTSANGKNTIFYQTTQPATTGRVTGDTWFDAANGYKIYVWNGSAWTASQDAAIAAAQTTATNAQTAAGNAQTTANTKTKTFIQSATPTATTVGDIWIDTANGNVIKVWEGSSWVNRADAAIAAAQNTANAAQTSANGRNRIYYQTAQPTGGTYVAGDTWFDTDDGNQIYVYNGSTWAVTDFGASAIADLAITNAKIADTTITNAKIANLDAAKITTGTLDANRIGANTITANKILVGDFTNLAADGNFVDVTKSSWTGSGSVMVSAGQPNRLKVVTAASGNNDQANVNTFQVTAGEQIYGEMWVYGETTNVGAGGPNLHLAVSLNDGTTTWPTFQSLTRAAVSGAWTKLSGKVTIPTNAKSARVEPAISFSADAVGNIYYFREISVRRMATGNLIVDGAIQAGSAIIGTGAIGTAQIANLAVDTAQIKDTAITNAKIGNLAVGTAQIQDTAITNAKIANLDAGKITTGTLDANRIGADTITATHIASDAVTANELAANSITAAKGQISDLAVTTAKIADLAITTAKIGDAQITNAKIGNLDAAKITSGTIDANRIAAGSISAAKLQVGDFENLATINEVQGTTVSSYGQTQVSAGYNTLVADSGSFFMFKDQTGPVPFLNGDHLYFRFTAKAPVATTVQFGIWIYNATGGNRTSVTSSLSVGTTDTVITGSILVPATDSTWGPAKQYVLGLQSVSNKGIAVKEVVVRRMNGGELLVDGTITAGSAIIANGAIGNAQIANLAVGTAQIQDTAITTAKIANLAVDTAQIKDTAITNAKIANLDAAKITTGTLDANRIGADTITATHIASDAITANELAANSITAAKGQISALAVGTAQIQDTAITTAKIANLAVDTAQIKDTAITNAKIANLDAAKITSGTIDANRIGANTIDVSKLNVTVGGSNLVSNSSFEVDSNNDGLADGWNTWARGAGDAGRVFTNTRPAGLFPGSTYAQRVTSTTVTNTEQSSIQASTLFAVSPGDVATLSLYGRASVAGTFSISIRCEDDTAAYKGDASFTAAFTTTTQRFSGTVTIPAGATRGKITITTPGALTNGHWFEVDGVKAEIGNIVSAWSPMTSELLPGTIQAGMLAANSVSASNIQAGAISAGSAIIGTAAISSAQIAQIDAGKITTGTLDANRIGADTITATHIASDAITVNELAANSITAAKGQIADLAITTAKIQDTAITNAKIANLDAAKITTGTLDANRIGANSITTAKLAVGDFTDLVDNGTFESDFANWTVSGATITTTLPYSGTKSAYFTGGNSIVQERPIPVTPGDKFVVSVWYKTSADKAGVGGIRLMDQAGGEAATYSISYDVGVNTAWTKLTTVATIKAGVLTMRPRIAFALTAGNVTIDSYSIRRQTGAVYIEDGAIQAGSAIIGTGAIGTAQIGTAAVKTAQIDDLAVTSAKIAQLDAGKITTGYLDAARLAAGTITAQSGIIASLDAGVLTAGTLSAARLGAKSITTDKLVVSSSDNLVVEADFGNGGASWGTLNANKAIVATAGRNSLAALRVTGTTATQTISNLVNRVTVGTEDRFRGSFYMKSSVAAASGAVKLYMKAYSTATSSTPVLVATSQAVSSNVWTLVEGYSNPFPTGVTSVEFYLEVTNAATATTLDIDYVSVTRAADARLVVDGAIDGKTITGAIIQTASPSLSGARLVMDSTGLRGWDGSNKQYLSASANGLAVTGSLGATGDGVDYSVYNNGVFGSRPVSVGIGGAAGYVGLGIGGSQWPYPSPLTAGQAIPGIAYRPTTVPMYDLASITARDGVILSMQSGVTQADFNAWANETDSGGYLKNAGKQYVTTGFTLNKDGINFSKYVDAPEFRIGGQSMNTGLAEVFDFSSYVNNSQIPVKRLMGSEMTINTALSTDTSLAAFDANGLYINNAGVYDVHFSFGLVGGPGGARNFAEIGIIPDDRLLSRACFGAAEDSVNAIATGVKLNAGDVLKFEMFQNSGGSRNVTGRIRLSLVAAPGPTRGWATGDITQTGNFNLQGDMLSKPRYAQFYNNGFTVANNYTPWDTGPVTEDTGKSRNNNFAAVGPYAGSVKFTQSGWYQVSCFMIPTSGDPLDTWMRIFLGSTGENLGQAGNRPQSEIYLSTVPIYIAANDYIRSTVVSRGGFTTNSVWKITKFPWSLT